MEDGKCTRCGNPSDSDPCARCSAYVERIEDKRERLEDRAAAARSSAASLHATAHRMADVIPFGQPILVGHHSEKRDRRYREKIHNKFAASFAAAEKASDLERRAGRIGTAGISSDDPAAPKMLDDKVAALEAERDAMKAINAAFKKGGGMAAVVAAGLLDEKAAAELAHRMTFSWCKDRPFPPYALTNIGARIRDAKARAGRLERAAAAPEREPVEGDGYTISEDRDANRVRIVFPGKPSEEVRSRLKGRGFRWAPSEGAWQRQGGPGVFELAERLMKGGSY